MNWCNQTTTGEWIFSSVCLLLCLRFHDTFLPSSIILSFPPLTYLLQLLLPSLLFGWQTTVHNTCTSSLAAPRFFEPSMLYPRVEAVVNRLLYVAAQRDLFNSRVLFSFQYIQFAGKKKKKKKKKKTLR
eukprot:gnl/Hemi2/12054_TR4118_c0_g1_i1.p2 gnl/Hemi2/12054_TR4118_c0_g1~~gnl/Hemi2/12054_TR4118_c0_g1_i1.p2  ORF type:complete len:129 (-),score=4.94 gnl/Hemi2/12054_TR4118_c0_g1_i1:5-391(-)